MTPVTYSIDTSALLDAWVRYYPPEHFPNFWRRIENLILESRFVVSEEVLRDINKHDDALSEWLNARQREVVEWTDNAITEAVRQILQGHERLVMSGGTRSHSDPFVIAVARLRHAAVVTGEKGGTSRRPKIPSVCADMGIPCFGLLEMIKREGWVFD